MSMASKKQCPEKVKNTCSYNLCYDIRSYYNFHLSKARGKFGFDVKATLFGARSNWRSIQW